MRTLTLIILLSFLAYASLQSQQRVIREARLLIESGMYIQAIESLHPLLVEKTPPGELFLLLGTAYLSIPGSKESALEYLEIAVQRYPLTKRPSVEALEAHFMLGQALHLNYRFTDAISKFDQLLEFTSRSQNHLIPLIERERQYSKNAIELIKEPLDYDIVAMGPAINTLHSEHSPVLPLDESAMFFTSNRPAHGMLNDIDNFFENIHVSYWRDGAWTASEALELPGSFMGNRATVSISPDGQTLIFFQSDGRVGNLYMTRFRFGSWSEPEPLPPPISSTFNETHASFSVDGNSIWFTSDRPGGFGGKDIYVSHLLPNGNWGEPINAGSKVNTPLNEESPFIHPTGTTLYFSSEGHNSMGGYDIFKSQLDLGQNLGSAINLGYPINTPGDDLFYMPTPDGQRVYFASTRKEGVGFSDIYLKSFPTGDERALAVVASHVFGSREQPLPGAIVRVFNSSSNEQVGVYRPNRNTGKVVAILSPGQKYMVTIEADGYQTREHEFDLPPREAFGTRQRAFYLPPFILNDK